MPWFQIACHRAALVGSRARHLYRNDVPAILAESTHLPKDYISFGRRCFCQIPNLASRRFGAKAWTPEEEKELIALRKRGVKWSQMKFHLEGRTTLGIIGHMNTLAHGDGPLAKEARDLRRAHRKGIPLVPEDVRRAVQLHDEGLTPKQIDEAIGKGHGPARIRQFIREPAHFLNPQRETRFTPEEDLLLAQLVPEKLRWSEIAKHFPSKSVRTLQSRWEFELRTKDTPSESVKTNNGRRAWTRRDIEEMLNLYKEGRTTKAIAERLDRTAHQVRWKLNVHGLVRGGHREIDAEAADSVLQGLGVDERVSPDLGEEMRKLASSGMTAPQIALALNQKTNVVRYWLTHNGRNRQSAWTREEEANVKRLLDEGKRPAEIAEEIGRTKLSVQAKIHILKGAQIENSKESQKYLSWTPEEETRLKELYLEGKPVKAIAAELGRPHHGVNAKIVENRKAGRLPMKTREISQPADTEAVT